MTGVDLEAQINPQGNETTYEFLSVWREMKPRERGEPLAADSPAQEGHIGAGYSDVTVSAFLSGLQPGYTYWFEVVATSLGNSTRSTVAVPYFDPNWYDSGYAEGPPYVPTPDRAGCASESGNLAAAETVRKQRELEAEEATAKQAEEAALKRSTEKHRAGTPPASCKVPGVLGRTLSVARRAIVRAHCRLGRPRCPARYRGALIITGQTPHQGSMLRNGALVKLVLGPVHKRHHHSPRAKRSQALTGSERSNRYFS